MFHRSRIFRWLPSCLVCLTFCLGCQQHDGDYELVSPDELDCSLEDFYYNATVGPDGEAIPTGGGIGRFLCDGREIPLKSNSFDDGFVVTKDFGRLQVTFSSSLTDSGFGILATEQQKRKLKEYVEKG